MPKAKRRLTDISFEKDGAAVALVGKSIGGPANGRDTALILKSTANFSDEFLTKAQKVRVTMELPDFLQKFFDIWYEDAQILARMMGYVPEENEESSSDYYEDYIESKLESFEILKSAYESESIAEVLSNLDEDSYLKLLRDQELVEKAFKNVESVKEEDVKTETSEQPVVADVPEDNIIKSQEDNQANKAVKAEQQTEVIKMTDKTVEKDTKVSVEMVEKSQLESVNKALAEQTEALNKALATVATFEAERKEAVNKSRKETLKATLGSEDKVEELFKAVGELEAEQFDSVVAILKSLKDAAESDTLFEETGANDAEEQINKAAGLKARLEAKYKNK